MKEKRDHTTGSRDGKHLEEPHWDWISEKDVNAFLIHAIGELGMEKGPTTRKPKLKPDLEILSELDKKLG